MLLQSLRCVCLISLPYPAPLSTSPALSMEWLKNAYCTRPSKVSLSLLRSSLISFSTSASLHGEAAVTTAPFTLQHTHCCVLPLLALLPNVVSKLHQKTEGTAPNGSQPDRPPASSSTDPLTTSTLSSLGQEDPLVILSRSRVRGSQPSFLHSVNHCPKAQSTPALVCLLWKRWPSIRSLSTHIRMFSSTYKCLNPIPTSLVPILESKWEWNSLLSTLTLSFIISCMLYP